MPVIHSRFVIPCFPFLYLLEEASMKRFLVLSCVAAIGLGVASDVQAQILRRRCGGSGCGASAGCNAGSSGCNVSSSRGCNLSPALPASIAVPAQIPPSTFVPSARAGTAGGAVVEQLFQRAAGCTSGSCPVEPQAAPSSVPGPSDATRIQVDARSAMAFCTMPGSEPAGRLAGDFPRVAAAAPTADMRWSNLVAAFR